MKHFITAFLLLGIFLAISCQDTPTPKREKADLSDTDFIYLKDNHFELRNEPFFPIMLNYIVSFRNINKEFVISPYIDYDEVGVYEANTKEEIAHQLSGHFQLIKEMGFNTIRVCFDRMERGDAYFYKADEKAYFIATNSKKILNGLETFVNLAGENGLRIMLLIKNPAEHESIENFTVRILKRFKDNPVIFAYDFMNKPLYLDKEPTVKKKKKELYRIVSHWDDLMYKHAPNQLFTIGFTEPLEVHRWDPALLPVDFVSFHTYNPLRVKNEIYWYSSYVDKAWMIGETSLPADNDSISYEEQASFMRDVYQYVVDCGGAGFGWWNFQEEAQGTFEAKYTGILNHEDTTTTQDEKYTIQGSIKPAAKEIPFFSEYTPKEKVRPVNYFNIVGYNNYLIKGKILNKKTKQPIEGAVVRGWNKEWLGQNTFTDANGEFMLYSNDECVHFEISAPKMEKIKLKKSLKYTQTADGTFDRNNLPQQKLEYQNICYKSFLKDNATSVFDFDETKFNKSKFTGEIGELYLSPL